MLSGQQLFAWIKTGNGCSFFAKTVGAAAPNPTFSNFNLVQTALFAQCFTCKLHQTPAYIIENEILVLRFA